MGVFKPGDVAQLKSGGPLITIYEVIDDYGDGEKVNAKFWDENAQTFQRQGFDAITLKLVENYDAPLGIYKSGI